MDVETGVCSAGSRPLHIMRPTSTQNAFSSIKDKAKSKGLHINDSKTQILSVSSTNYDTKVEIRMTDRSIIESIDEIKMLGFKFSSAPVVSAQI